MATLSLIADVLRVIQTAAMTLRSVSYVGKRFRKSSFWCTGEAPKHLNDLIKCPRVHFPDGIVETCGHIIYCHQCVDVSHVWDSDEEDEENVDEELPRIDAEVEAFCSERPVYQGSIQSHCKVLWVYLETSLGSCSRCAP